MRSIIQNIDIKKLSIFLSTHMVKRFYEDANKTKEENIKQIITWVMESSQDIDIFLSNTIKRIRNRELKYGLIRFLISEKFGIGLSYNQRGDKYVDKVLESCVLIQCPQSTVVVTHEGKIKFEENQYLMKGSQKFIIAHKILKNDLNEIQKQAKHIMPKHLQYQLSYKTDEKFGLFSNNGDEIIPCHFENISWRDYLNRVKIWHNNIGYLLFPIGPLKYVKEDILEEIVDNYCYSEWILQDNGGLLYRLSLSDFYLSDMVMYEPGYYCSFKEYDWITDCEFIRPDIYNLDEHAYIKRMESYSDEEKIEMLINNAKEITTLIGDEHIVPINEFKNPKYYDF